MEHSETCSTHYVLFDYEQVPTPPYNSANQSRTHKEQHYQALKYQIQKLPTPRWQGLTTTDTFGPDLSFKTVKHDTTTEQERVAITNIPSTATTLHLTNGSIEISQARNGLQS
ncbi:BTB/POZ domain-containing protein 3 [Striga asiatica]|uniref:BTB/POZ domain-containing protein 3 n=1 Tax=Striga asiatica TaxID=4170 RepID=A0A5A7NY90_STRAF|nr:BTB/POZ domain-containing protein 3 [Striga asiatica]